MPRPPTKSTKISTYKTNGDVPRPGSRAAELAETRAKQDEFLEAYILIGTAYGTAKRVGIHRSTHYRWLTDDPDYAARYQEAHIAAIDLAEQELRKAGLVGYDEPVYQGGRRVGSIRKRSVTALIFYLKGRRPEVFGDRHEISGPGGGPIETKTDLSGLSVADLKQLRMLVTKAKGANASTP